MGCVLTYQDSKIIGKNCVVTNRSCLMKLYVMSVGASFSIVGNNLSQRLRGWRLLIGFEKPLLV
jgi:hypothetical protein